MTNSGGMMYNRAGMQTLYEDLSTYKSQLTTQEDDANSLANTLQNNWSGQGQQAFEAQHKILMGSLSNIINLLAAGMNGVQQAEGNAFTTDTKVAGTFFEG